MKVKILGHEVDLPSDRVTKISGELASARSREDIYKAAREATDVERTAYFKAVPGAAFISTGYSGVRDALENGHRFDSKFSDPINYGFYNAIQRVTVIEAAKKARTPDELKRALEEGYRHGLQVKGTAGTGSNDTYTKEDVLTRIRDALSTGEISKVPRDLGLREVVERMLPKKS